MGSNANPDEGFVPSLISLDNLSGPPTFIFSGYRGSFAGAKRPECEVNHSPPSSSQVKKRWSYTSTPPICLYDVDRDKFTFNF
jgi:hypothetical protein